MLPDFLVLTKELIFVIISITRPNSTKNIIAATSITVPNKPFVLRYCPKDSCACKFIHPQVQKSQTISLAAIAKQFARKDTMSFPLPLEIVRAILANLKEIHPP